MKIHIYLCFSWLWMYIQRFLYYVFSRMESVRRSWTSIMLYRFGTNMADTSSMSSLSYFVVLRQKQFYSSQFCFKLFQKILVWLHIDRMFLSLTIEFYKLLNKHTKKSIWNTKTLQSLQLPFYARNVTNLHINIFFFLSVKLYVRI